MTALNLFTTSYIRITVSRVYASEAIKSLFMLLSH